MQTLQPWDGEGLIYNMILYFLWAAIANGIITIQERPGGCCGPSKARAAYCDYSVNHLIVKDICPEMKASQRYWSQHPKCGHSCTKQQIKNGLSKDPTRTLNCGSYKFPSACKGESVLHFLGQDQNKAAVSVSNDLPKWEKWQIMHFQYENNLLVWKYLWHLVLTTSWASWPLP